VNKVAVFFDCCDIATFYTKLQLLDEFKLLGFEADLYITNTPSQYCFSKDYYKKSDFFDERVRFGYPKPSEYNALIFGARHDKNCTGARMSLVSSFQNARKKTIVFQDSANLDYAPLTGCTAYGFPSLNQLNLVKTAHISMNKNDISKSFEIPLLSNLSWKKQVSCKQLSVNEFYDFYNIPKDLKVVGFFPDGEHGHPSVLSSHWLHKELNNIANLLKEEGYFLMSKLHPYEYYGRKKNYYSGKFSNEHYSWVTPVIKEEHACELVNYADFAISSISCVSFEHYLYNLVHLNVGMHPDDSKTLNNSGYELFLSNGYVKSYIEKTNFDISTLTFGKKYAFEEFKSNPAFYIREFLRTKHEVKDEYVHYQNHPILGQSYTSTVKNVAETLIKIIND